MEVITQHLCKTSDVGLHGNIFGGTILGWLDAAGFLLASRICHTPHLMTLKFEEVIFAKPIQQGDVISIYGSVKKMGDTSITIYLEVRKWGFFPEKEEEMMTSTTVVFVKIDPKTRRSTSINHGKN